jgi:hypothetical protein
MSARSCRFAIGAAIGAWMIASPLFAAEAAKVSKLGHPRMVRHISVPAANELNQPPDGVNGLFSDPVCEACGTGQQAVADNFVINEAGGAFEVDEFIIFGGYFPGNVPNVTDTFSVLIHSDSGGVPGAVVSSVTGIQATARVTTGVVLFGVDEYMFTFDLAAPAVLPNGTYWVEITNSTAGNTGNDFFWETGTLDPTHGIVNGVFATTVPGSGWNVQPNDFSLQINGITAPVELQHFSVE